jgi:hypothetical protein
MYPNNYKLINAAVIMCCNRSGNKVYGWLRRKLSEKMKIDNPNKNGKARLKYIEEHGFPPPRNWKLTESGKKILSDRML